MRGILPAFVLCALPLCGWANESDFLREGIEGCYATVGEDATVTHDLMSESFGWEGDTDPEMGLGFLYPPVQGSTVIPPKRPQTPPPVDNDDVLFTATGPDPTQVDVYTAGRDGMTQISTEPGLHTAVRTPDYELREPIRVHQRELYEQTMSVVGFGGTGRAVARRLKAGTVWVNAYNLYDVALPFGGYKQSGFGRELGKHSLELYTQIKSVNVSLG